MDTFKRVLVTGASGKTGRRVANLLKKQGCSVIAASHTSPHKDGTPFDWLDNKTHHNVLAKEVDSAYLIAPFGVYDSLKPMQPFIDHLLKKNVKRIVLLSASTLEKGDPMMGAVHAYLAEHAPSYVVLRPTWFMQSFSEQHHAESIRKEHTIYSAAQNGKVAFISADDIAAVAAVALTSPTLANGDYILTGPEALSYGEVAHIISQAIGRTIYHQQVSTQELATIFKHYGLSAEYAEALAAMEANIATGNEAKLTNNVKEITGKQPVDFRSFAEHAVGSWVTM